MGLGVQSGGLGVAAFMRDHGADLVVTDLRSEAQLAPSVAALGSTGIRYVLGRHELDDFQRAEIVVRNPAVRDSSPYLRAARAARAYIEMEFTLFLRWCRQARVIGVTGTRGKTTTATALHAMLVAGGERARLAGNMRVSALAQLHEIEPGSTVVLELSSAQLEGLAGTGLRTSGAIVTNLMSDHLDRYPDMQAYAQAKLSLVANQRPGDWAVIPAGSGWPDWFAARAGGTVVRPDLEQAPPGWTEAPLSGRHNRANLALAAAAARQAGVSGAAIADAVRGFGGVAARQELIGCIDDVRAYNDTTATTPEAALAALATIHGPWVLIAGGSDKRLDFAPLAERLREADGLRAVVLLPGSGTDRLQPLLDGCRIEPAADMAQAVDHALALARPGDAVLLSPACASFGLFTNEFDRGDQFVARLRERGLRPAAGSSGG
jgi:UDP-N-acetylmuramoylalanine--D-glutamate ligase